MIVQHIIFLCISTESLIFSICNGVDVSSLLKFIPIRASNYFALFDIVNIYISVDAEHQFLLILLHHHFVIVTSPMFSFIKR
jgi:hypothetical protein